MPTPAKSKLDIEKAPNPEAAALALAAQQASKAPTTTGPIFDQAKYDQLKAYNSAAAEAYKASTMPKRAPVEASPLGQYSAAAGRLMETAKESVPAAATAAREWVKAPEIAPTPAAPATSISAPDPDKFKAAEPAMSISAPDPTKFKEPSETQAEDTAASAAAVVTAPPSKVGDVLDKLREEEAKGGPDFWDVIQAAAAGWGGQVPLYVQKEIAAKEAETEQAKTEALLARQAEISKTERAEEQEFQRGLAREEMANRLKLAGLSGVGGLPRLSASEFVAGGQ
jgi:hypothetical protein